jgi:hypothetical protein
MYWGRRTCLAKAGTEFESRFMLGWYNSLTGLPDGLFSNQKSKFGSILEGLRLENVDIFYGHMEYFTDIWDILWLCVHFVFIWYIFPVLVSCTKKNLATLYFCRLWLCYFFVWRSEGICTTTNRITADRHERTLTYFSLLMDVCALFWKFFHKVFR